MLHVSAIIDHKYLGKSHFSTHIFTNDYIKVCSPIQDIGYSFWEATLWIKCTITQVFEVSPYMEQLVHKYMYFCKWHRYTKLLVIENSAITTHTVQLLTLTKIVFSLLTCDTLKKIPTIVLVQSICKYFFSYFRIFLFHY